MIEKMPDQIWARRFSATAAGQLWREGQCNFFNEEKYISDAKHQAELAALKAAVRDMAGALTNNLDYRTCLPREVGEEFRNVLTKHAALIEAEVV